LVSASGWREVLPPGGLLFLGEGVEGDELEKGFPAIGSPVSRPAGREALMP
jgi:hypothetical protein